MQGFGKGPVSAVLLERMLITNSLDERTSFSSVWALHQRERQKRTYIEKEREKKTDINRERERNGYKRERERDR